VPSNKLLMCGLKTNLMLLYL